MSTNWLDTSHEEQINPHGLVINYFVFFLYLKVLIKLRWPMLCLIQLLLLRRLRLLIIDLIWRVIMKRFCFVWVFIRFTSFRCCTVQIPKYTPPEYFKGLNGGTGHPARIMKRYNDFDLDIQNFSAKKDFSHTSPEINCLLNKMTS